MISAEGQRALHVKIMNMVYNDVIAPDVPNAQAKYDWDMITDKIKQYGALGEEIFLRARTIHAYNQQDWVGYKDVAKEYLAKYGANIKPEEKKMFEEKL